MIKKIFLLVSIILLSLTSNFAVGNILSCSFSTSCTSGSNMFYANKNFMDTNSNILSSNIATSKDINYNYGLCCKINTKPNLGLNISIENFNGLNSQCNNGGKNIFYLTSSTNARLGILNYNDGLINNNFNKNFYSKKVCVNIPDNFSNLDLVISDDLRYKNTGYECLFKTNNITNGLVSSCNATFAASKQYKYTIWGKLWENTNTLKCNVDCTSKLDGRVYSACSQKVDSCKYVPKECDGSLYGAWVKYDSNHDGIINNSDLGEIQCSAPWDIVRGNKFTNLPIRVDAVKNKCSNIIKKKYSVVLDNELVTMNVYICNNNNNN